MYNKMLKILKMFLEVQHKVSSIFLQILTVSAISNYLNWFLEINSHLSMICSRKIKNVFNFLKFQKFSSIRNDIN